MPPPYFQKRWPPFTVADVVYSFDHLDEFTLHVVDSAGHQRAIIVSYTDHVFTKDGTPQDDISALFPKCSRPSGVLCPRRYGLSLGLRGHIQYATGGEVWIVDGHDHYAHLPIVTHDGRDAMVAVMFSLEKVSGIPADLHMRIRSAYECDIRVPTTFGSVRFRHLVRLRMEGKRPPKRTERGRRQPKAPV